MGSWPGHPPTAQPPHSAVQCEGGAHTWREKNGDIKMENTMREMWPVTISGAGGEVKGGG